MDGPQVEWLAKRERFARTTKDEIARIALRQSSRQKQTARGKRRSSSRNATTRAARSSSYSCLL